jgi:putative acetyltransferase
MIKIRPEKGEDYTAIHEINVLAFGRENEARLVENLRNSPDFTQGLSLVAIKDKMVVGHILFSRIAIETKTGSFPALSLAPMAVHPEFQKQGIGSKLVQQGIGTLPKTGAPTYCRGWPPRLLPSFWVHLSEGEGT